MRRKLILSLVLIMVLAYGTLLATVIGGLRPTLGLDLQGGVSVTQQPKAGTEFNSASLDLAVEKIRDRVDALGVAEPEILRQGDTIVVNLPGVENQDQAISLVQVTGQVYLRPVLTACFEVAPPDSGSTTTVAGTGSSTTVAVASADTVAPGPARPVSNGNTTPTEAGTSTTSAATATATGATSTTTATATATGATSTT
ncbi:MAG: hypothetical protein ABMA25_29080, partial [Ilumatobacteraceae bacterium]